MNRKAIFDLHGQVAVVTGGGQGLGLAMACFLAEFGARMVIADRDAEAAEAACKEIHGLGREALPVPTDVTRPEQLRALVERIIGEWGRIDILLGSAGINIREPALEVTEEHWDRILDVNLKGLFFATQAAARVMKAQGYGRIIHIASDMAVIALHNRAAYCASKGGVAALTRELAVEWALHGITVNAIAPSFFVTPMNRELLEDPETSRFIREQTPLGRPGNPEEMGSTVLFLASPASSYVTGHLLVVDGGYTIR